MLGNAPWGNMPDKYQHLEMSISAPGQSIQGFFKPGGGGGTNPNQWLHSIGYQGNEIERTPGPNDAAGGMGASYLGGGGGPPGMGGFPSFGGFPGGPGGSAPGGMPPNPFMGGAGGSSGFGVGSPGGFGGFGGSSLPGMGPPGFAGMGSPGGLGAGSYGRMASPGMGSPMGMPGPNPFMMMQPPASVASARWPRPQWRRP